MCQSLFPKTLPRRLDCGAGVKGVLPRVVGSCVTFPQTWGYIVVPIEESSCALKSYDHFHHLDEIGIAECLRDLPADAEPHNFL